MLQKIQTPTLFIQSYDDTIVGYRTIPRDKEILENENLAMLETYGGGHIGYFESVFSTKQWLPKPAMAFFNMV